MLFNKSQKMEQVMRKIFAAATSRGLAASALLMAGSAYAVGPTTDLITPSDSQREATFASVGGQPTQTQASPAVAFGSPIGFGLNNGQLAVGIGGQTTDAPGANHFDGSMGVALGLGNSAESLGFELTANLISLRDNFGEDGSFNAKIHHMINQTTSVAVGAESFGGWGAARESRISSYAAITSVVNPGVPVVLNLGAGTNRFSSNNETNRTGVFGSVAVIPTDRLSFVVDYTGIDTNVGVSVVPAVSLPVTLTLGYVNLQEQEGLSREFAGGLGYLYRF